jgi:hypothetical protein
MPQVDTDQAEPETIANLRVRKFAGVATFQQQGIRGEVLLYGARRVSARGEASQSRRPCGQSVTPRKEADTTIGLYPRRRAVTRMS